MRNNVGLFVTKRALMQPDTEALVDLGRNRRFTFTELNDRVNMVADALHSIGVTKGDRVTLVGFGTFYSSKRAARTGKNPRTGEKIKIAAATVPKFSAGTAFKATVNKKKAK